MTLHHKLKYARKRANFTLATVSERAQIGQSSISEFENDKREPSVSQLVKLANVYQRPVEFFMSDSPIPREVVLWREKPTEAPEEVETRFLKLCRQYANLEKWSGEKIQADLPSAKGVPASFEYGDAEALAKKVRDRLRLGDAPGQVLIRVLEETCGVKVFHLDFEPSGTAACTSSDDTGAAILLNVNSKRWRRNFDLAHELFHLLTWAVFRNDDDMTAVEASKKEEKLATCFARNLLMPIDALRTAVNARRMEDGITTADLFDIARQFDVSVEALIWQLRFAYNVPEEKCNKMIADSKSWASSYEERVSDRPPPEYPSRYRSLAKRALRNGEISLGKFAEYIDITRKAARKYVSEEGEDAGEIQLTAS